MEVAVVGCGYVGVVTAVGLASVGHRVLGVEAAPGRRRQLASGTPPVKEPGLESLLQRTLREGRFQVTGDLGDAIDADVVLLAVQTPPAPDGSVDLGPVTAATRGLASCLRRRTVERPLVVAVRSTVVPGTVDAVVAPALRASEVSARVAAASNPEFLREGSAVEDFLHPDRVVVGSHEPWANRVLADLYAPLEAPVVTLTPTTAELSKYASNALLATLISYSNELARVAEVLPGVDVEEVLGTLHLDRRLRVPGGGDPAGIVSYLRAGCGYGGSCLPKDLSALIAHARSASLPVPLLDAVREINDTQPSRLVALADSRLGGLCGRRVTVLGVAFKAGTDDLRDSPGIRVAEELLRAGAEVRAYDPLVDMAGLDCTAGKVPLAPSLEEAVAYADACLVTTGAPEFSRLPDLVTGTRDGPVVIDGRRFLDPGAFPPGRYLAVGMGRPGPDQTDSPR